MPAVMKKTRHEAGFADRISPDLAAVLLWLGFVAVSLAIHHDAIASLTFWDPDPDNAMRLAQVRDLAAGQDWFDTRQYRVDPAGGGGLMHWSRFIDAQIVGLTWLLGMFLGPETAERWALTIYPPLLALPLLLVFSRILQILGNRQFTLIGLAIAATTLSYLHHFAPLNIDHHNWQVLLSVLLLWLALRPATFLNGLLSAFVASIYVEISLEGLPFLGFFWALFVLDWLRDRASEGRLRGFSAGVILLPALWVLAFRGTANLAAGFCDSFSLPYIVGVASAGAVFLIFLVGPSRWTAALPQRLLVIMLAGIACAAGFVLTGPACLSGPFGELEPLVRTFWYEPIHEGQPLWKQVPARVVAYIIPTGVGAAATIWACRHFRRGPAAENWMRLGLLVLFSTILAIFVVRTLAVAHAYMVPAFAALATSLWRWNQAATVAWRRLCGHLLFLLSIPTVDIALGFRLSSLAAGPSAASGQKSSCLRGGRMVLADEPPALLLSSIGIAPTLLVNSPHSVVATGHHRNHAAIARILSALLAPPTAARPLVNAEGARYLVFCENELAGLAAASPRGLAAQLLQGQRIDWLQPEPHLSQGAFRVYRIVPQRGEDVPSAQISAPH